MKIWSCKIGEVHGVVAGADWPMRVAVRKAYRAVTGQEPAFTFSGWGAELTEGERACVEDREPAAAQPAPAASGDGELLDDVLAQLKRVATYQYAGDWSRHQALMDRLDAARRGNRG